MVCRRATPLPWRPVWFPALLLLGVVAVSLLWFPAAVIQRAVVTDLQTELADAGHDWVGIDVSGQHVVLSGRPPREVDGANVLALAKGARSPTWLGRLVSPVHVRGNFTAPIPATPAAWSLTRDATAIRLAGVVADEAARTGMVDAAQSLGGPRGMSTTRCGSKPRMLGADETLVCSG